MAKLRQDTFGSLWSYHEEKAQQILHRVDDKILGVVRNFLDADKVSAGRLKTALVVSDPGISAPRHWLEQIDAQDESTKDIVIQLEASQSPNLQTALKNVIRTAIEAHSGPEDYTLFLASNKRLIPMSFDLELLQNYIERKHLGKVIISLQDVETFDTGVLSDLLSTLASWTDRIPFIALLGIATTVELFESRLSKSIVRLLDATVFDFGSQRDQLYEILCSIQCDPETKLYLGPAAINGLYEFAQDQAVNPSSFLRALKYIYMTHFFANPLSDLLERRISENEEIAPLGESIRNTTSFQRHCESLLAQGKSRTETIRQLLNNNAFLLTQAQTAVLSGVETLRRINGRIQHLVTLHQQLHPGQGSSLQLHAHLLQSWPNVTESPAYQEVVDRLRILTSDSLISLVFAHPDLFTNITRQTLTQLTTSISKLHIKHSTSSISPSVSPHTSYPAAKPAAPSPAQKEYTTLLNDLLSKLSTYCSPPARPNPTTLFLSEAFLTNTRTPLASTFLPRPRFAIERALSRPADYLGCDCCNDSTLNHHHTSSNPQRKPNDPEQPSRDPTSILYNLINEAGREINVRDLWDTFQHIIDPTSGLQDDEDVDPAEQEQPDEKARETHSLALFYQALANLKMLGLVKSSASTTTAGGVGKKGVDVISRTTWKGL